MMMGLRLNPLQNTELLFIHQTESPPYVLLVGRYPVIKEKGISTRASGDSGQVNQCLPLVCFQ